MTRVDVLTHAAEYFDSGQFLADLRRRVAIPTESQDPSRAPELRAYLADEMAPALHLLGCTTRIVDNGAFPLLVGTRHEADDLPTVLVYGHADVATCRRSEA